MQTLSLVLRQIACMLEYNMSIQHHSRLVACIEAHTEPAVKALVEAQHNKADPTRT